MDNKYKVMLLVAGVFVLFLSLFIGMGQPGIDNEATKPEEKQLQQDSSKQNIQKQQDSQEEQLEKIQVTTELQDMYNAEGRQKCVISVNNTSDKIFSGHLQVLITTDDGLSKGTAAFQITKLNPGEKTDGIMWIKSSMGEGEKLRRFWSDVKFE